MILAQHSNHLDCSLHLNLVVVVCTSLWLLSKVEN